MTVNNLPESIPLFETREEALQWAVDNRYDAHTITAAWYYGIQPKAVTPGQRQAQKGENHSFLYGRSQAVAEAMMANSRAAVDSSPVEPAAQCLITGCGLLQDSRFAHGDLFCWGPFYLFNAVMGARKILWWAVNADEATRVATLSPRHVILPSSAPCFEKGGVMVFPKAVATLSPEAEAYLKGRPAL